MPVISALRRGKQEIVASPRLAWSIQLEFQAGLRYRSRLCLNSHFPHKPTKTKQIKGQRQISNWTFKITAENFHLPKKKNIFFLSIRSYEAMFICPPIWYLVYYWNGKPLYHVMGTQTYHSHRKEGANGSWYFIHGVAFVVIAQALWVVVKFRLSCWKSSSWSMSRQSSDTRTRAIAVEWTT